MSSIEVKANGHKREGKKAENASYQGMAGLAGSPDRKETLDSSRGEELDRLLFAEDEELEKAMKSNLEADLEALLIAIRGDNGKDEGN